MLSSSSRRRASPSGRCVISALLAWVGWIYSAHGASVEIPVTPTNLDQSSYVFAVSTNSAQGGVAFHVTITAKTHDIYSDSDARLSLVIHKTDAGSRETSIQTLKPAIDVKLKKKERVWQAEFTVSNEALKTAGLYFVFTELVRTKIDGKDVPMPAAVFYELRLQDFVNR
jgi:hypothetical protein